MTQERLAPNEDVRFGFRVNAHHCNMRPVCHGGMLATFLDVALARGLRCAAGLSPPLPTISLSLDFLAPAALGVWVDARVSVMRVGKSTAFVSALLHADEEPVLRGSGVFRHFSRS
jgi:acyl-coenzyme A thioesterase PaaI-like protein